MTPEKIHLMVVHIPIIGYLFASVVLVIAIVAKNTLMLRSACILGFLASVFIGVSMDSGEKALERYENEISLQEYISEEMVEFGKAHGDFAHDFAKIGYALLGLNLLTFAFTFFRPKWGVYFGMGVLVIQLIFFGFSLKIADLGGKVRRPEMQKVD